jgi:hypothetical protein
MKMIPNTTAIKNLAQALDSISAVFSRDQSDRLATMSRRLLRALEHEVDKFEKHQLEERARYENAPDELPRDRPPTRSG